MIIKVDMDNVTFLQYYTEPNREIIKIQCYYSTDEGFFDNFLCKKKTMGPQKKSINQHYLNFFLHTLTIESSSRQTVDF